MKARRILSLTLSLAILSLSALSFQSCTALNSQINSQNAPSYGAGTGAILGATAGALLDKKNRWRGGAIGAVIGATLGASLVQISQQAAIQAAQTNRTVTYKTRNATVIASPASAEYYNQNQHTICKKIHKRIYKSGKLVSDSVEEVCRATKVENTY